MRKTQNRSTSVSALRCVLLGHRRTFWVNGSTMQWKCERCGQDAGSKTYPNAQAARRFAAAFDRRGTADLGHRAPLLGMFPLRLWYRLRQGRR